MATSSPSPTTSYWCHRCTRFVRVLTHDATVTCPYCDTGFLEEIESTPSPPPLTHHHHRRRFPSSHVHDQENPTPTSRRVRRSSGGDRSPFNPVIVLRGAADDSESNSFELYYDDAAGSGLRPLPATMSEFLMGSGFDRLLEQLAQIEITGLSRPENPPASKSAVESMPVVKIDQVHVGSESHCAVCKEAFEFGSEAREMPCNHIYHSDCILPWLSMRNSCPVCRHELPVDQNSDSGSNNDEEATGLTIWRLPGGGFAVGRFSGARRPGERELPVVYTEMDGGFNGSGAPRRVLWASRSRGGRESRGIVRAFRNLASFLGRFRSNNNSSRRTGSETGSGAFGRTRSQSSSVFGRYVQRRSRAWVLDD